MGNPAVVTNPSDPFTIFVCNGGAAFAIGWGAGVELLPPPQAGKASTATKTDAWVRFMGSSLDAEMKKG
jgi:hypothetical protein